MVLFLHKLISNDILNDVMSKPRLVNPYLYTFSIFPLWKSIVYYHLCRDRIFFDKILVSEYNLFKRSNKANLFIALVQLPVSQIKMTFQEIRIIATGPCIANQLRDVNTICRKSWYIDAHIWKIYDFKIEVIPFIIHFSTELTTVVKFELYVQKWCGRSCICDLKRIMPSKKELVLDS